MPYNNPRVPETIEVPWCGTTAYFCYEAGHGYRCDRCLAVVGSMGMPKACHQAKAVFDAVEIIEGRKRK